MSRKSDRRLRTTSRQRSGGRKAELREQAGRQLHGRDHLGQPRQGGCKPKLAVVTTRGGWRIRFHQGTPA